MLDVMLNCSSSKIGLGLVSLNKQKFAKSDTTCSASPQVLLCRRCCPAAGATVPQVLSCHCATSRGGSRGALLLF
jgi:hypothetical protein